MPDWRASNLGSLVEQDLASLQTGPFGTVLKASEYAPEGVPLISVREIREGYFEVGENTPRVSPETTARLSKYVLRAGDIVFGRKGGVERNAIVKEEQDGWFLGSDGIRLRLSEGINQEFVSFQLRSRMIKAWLLQNAGGTTMPSLNQRILSRLPITLPPLEQQKAIAHVLGTLDDKIELNRKMNETLEQMARPLFKSWFVDFDPVHAKARGEKPFGMDDATAALFPDSFEDSELGPIPMGWRKARLSSWAECSSGGTPSKEKAEYWNGDIPWISPKVMTRIHADHAEHYVTEHAVGNGTKLAPAHSTLVMVRGMALHKNVRVSQALRPVTFNQDVKAFVGKEIHQDLLFFALLNAQPQLLTKVDSAGHGTGRLANSLLQSMPVTMPSPCIQQKLAQPLSSLNSKIITLREESRTLAKLRDALLPKLLSGELEIKDAEKVMGEAA